MFRTRVLNAVKSSFMPSFKMAIWIIKLMVPITLAITCLNYVGFISWISSFAAPLFHAFGLPAESGLVFLTAAFANIYSAIAVIATLGFDFRSVTILAVMCLICHNLIIESAIQKKTGASVLQMVLLRILGAFVMAGVLNYILPANMSGRLFLPQANLAPESWGALLMSFVMTMTPLVIKILVIIISLNIIQSILREFKIIAILSVPLRPFMAIFGLPRSTSFLWIICNVVGLAYGGAALVDEMENGDVSAGDSRLLNTHVAISHSLLEDTILFASIGIGVFWLIIPRVLLAIVAVWTRKLYILKLLPMQRIAQQ